MQTAGFSTPLQVPYQVSTSPASSLTNRIAEKQRELSEMHELQLSALLLEVATKNEELKKSKESHEALINDFKFNLTLISERDNELERFEEVFKEMKTKLHQSELSLSESKVNFAALEDKMKVKLAHAEEKWNQLNKKVKDMKSETLALKWNHTQEVQRLQERLDEFAHDMSNCLNERDRMLEKERTEITMVYDDKVCSHYPSIAFFILFCAICMEIDCVMFTATEVGRGEQIETDCTE